MLDAANPFLERIFEKAARAGSGHAFFSVWDMTAHWPTEGPLSDSDRAGFRQARDNLALDAAVTHLRENCSEGHSVLDEDVARLSPLEHANLNCLGRYRFRACQPGEALRPRRDPDTAEPG